MWFDLAHVFCCETQTVPQGFDIERGIEDPDCPRENSGHDMPRLDHLHVDGRWLGLLQILPFG